MQESRYPTGARLVSQTRPQPTAISGKLQAIQSIASDWPEFAEPDTFDTYFSNPVACGNGDLFYHGLMFASWMRPEPAARERLIRGELPEPSDWNNSGSVLWLVTLCGQPGIPALEAVREVISGLILRDVLQDGEKVFYSRHHGERFGWLVARER